MLTRLLLEGFHIWKVDERRDKCILIEFLQEVELRLIQRRFKLLKDGLALAACVRRCFQDELRQILFRKELADDIVNPVAAQFGANRLQFLKKTVKDGTLSRIGGDKIDDMHLVFLSVAVNAPHPLFQAIRVPRKIIVEHQVAELEVNSFARGFGCEKKLRLIPKRILRRYPLFVRHFPVDNRDGKPPRLYLLLKVSQRIKILREDENFLIRVFSVQFIKCISESLEFEFTFAVNNPLRVAFKTV